MKTEGKKGQTVQIRMGKVWAGSSLRAWSCAVLSGNLPLNHLIWELPGPKLGLSGCLLSGAPAPPQAWGKFARE